MKSRVRDLRSILLFPLAIIAAAAFAVPAGAGGVSWGPPETIESQVTGISSPAGSSVIWTAGAWHVVYPKNGGVRYAWRDAEGWHLGLMVAPEGTGARDPHLSAHSGHLIATWSGDTGMTREVFIRQGIMRDWGPIEAISSDGVLSQAPVVSGFADGSEALVVWEDSSATGFRVRGRTVSPSGWGEIIAISMAGADAREPTLTADPNGFAYSGGIWCVAWTDWRHGDPEIYRRCGGTDWEPEQRLTSLETACRHPCLLYARGGDLPYPSPRTSFEAAGPQGGATEIWIAPASGALWILSADDGVPSHGVNLAGFYGSNDLCGLMPTASTRARAAWTDDEPSASILRTRWAGNPQVEGADSIASAARSMVALGARPGTPTAAFLQVWIEEVAGQPVIVAREGATAGCTHHVLTAPTPLMLAPGGDPPTRLRVSNSCGGEGVPGAWMSLQIDQGLVDQLTFDPAQETWMYGETGDDGWIEFPIFGGGCAATGFSYADGGFNCFLSLQGAKSPDVNGDCVVGLDDRAYVQFRLGTSDFCADLDASGLVDIADLAVVDSTMGDHCPTITAVGDGDSGAGGIRDARGLRVTARPNPATRATALELSTPPLAGPVAYVIFDSSGREVRRLESPSSGNRSVTWDLRDGAGREVPAGCYFVNARRGELAAGTPVLVIR